MSIVVDVRFSFLIYPHLLSAVVSYGKSFVAPNFSLTNLYSAWWLSSSVAILSCTNMDINTSSFPCEANTRIVVIGVLVRIHQSCEPGWEIYACWLIKERAASYIGVPSKDASLVMSTIPPVWVLQTHVGAPSTFSHLVPTGSAIEGCTTTYQHSRMSGKKTHLVMLAR